jgi:ferritin-like metal-binding protein YciE
MANMKERVDQWLRDAHAMEQQAEHVLSGQSSRIENYPELAAKLDQHLKETQSQRERLEKAMERRGIKPSGIKDMSAKFTAMMQNFSGMFAGDEVMKGVLASYTFEHYEAQSYRILAAAAKTEGDNETARLCEEICKEEEAMAQWLRDNTEMLTNKYLHLEESEHASAKR